MLLKLVNHIVFASLFLLMLACRSTPSEHPSSSQVQDVERPVKTLKEPLRILSANKTPSSRLNENKLTLKMIMADPDWIGRPPESAYWSLDGQKILYSQKQRGNNIKDLWHIATPISSPVDKKTSLSQATKVVLSDRHLHANKNRVWNASKTLAAWEYQGSLFVYEKGQIRQLIKDNVNIANLKFLTDGRISFQKGNSIYAVSPTNGFVELLVSWTFADKPLANIKAEDYIAKQQLQLISTIKNKRRNNYIKFQHEKKQLASNPSLSAETFYFSKDNHSVETSLSPDGKWLVLVEAKKANRPDNKDIMPNYINDDGRISAEPVRKRVADEQPESHTIWLIDLVGQKKRKLGFHSLPGYNQDVLFAVKQENAKQLGQEYQVNRVPRHILLMNDWYWSQSAIQWHSQSNQLAIMLEAWDNKDRWLATVDVSNAKLISQHRLHDEAWVNYKFNSFGWLNKSKTLYYLSEESGYSNLYTKGVNGSAKNLTSGRFEVDNLTLSHDDQFIYFKANIKQPGIYETYRVNLSTSEIEALTGLNGMTDYILSPDESSLLLTHSSLTTPPELYYHHIASKQTQKVTQTISDEFLSIDWLAPDIVPIESSNSEQPIYSRVYMPTHFDNDKKRKAVVFNHGAGYLQNAHLGWSKYFREFMFHNLLVDKGYVVLDMDYRASSGYGRNWRTAIYRQMGKPEIEDLQVGVDWLAQNANVDKGRVGTYGGSYGGFLTFMAMFTQPDLFKAGAALRPVTDWAHYNHGYTSNILNTPDVDPIAYERSSPIYFAEGLKHPLLINAPMVDNNVFFVDVVRLVQRLIELEKTDFETAIYPVESHGFVQPSSWLDEYRRILKLFEQNL